ncbi:MAG: aromatic ring-hydroxylating dioxygenase subunit alpha [Pseudomonadota bacterium]
MPEDALPPADYNGLREARPGLPRERYTSDQAFRDDLEKIWYRHWIYACHESDLAQPLQFKVTEIGDQSVILLRDAEGALRAYHNVCRHRGAKLCPQGEGQLKAKALTCPYHSWTYGLDGRLRRVPSRWTPADFQKADFGLYPVALKEWRGLVFINLEGAETHSLDDSFGRYPDALAAWPLEDLRVTRRYSKVMACNWKLFWENFNECLHCPNLHPQLSQVVPIYGRGLINPKDAHDWQKTEASPEPRYQGGLAAGAATWSVEGAAQAVTFPDLSDEDRARGQTYAVSLPSCFVVGHVDYMRIVRLRPLDPTQTLLEAEWLFPEEALARPDFDPTPQVDFAITVLEQDAWACEINQQGLAARPFQQGVLMPEEYYLAEFHDWYRGALGDV